MLRIVYALAYHSPLVASPLPLTQVLPLSSHPPVYVISVQLRFKGVAVVSRMLMPHCLLSLPPRLCASGRCANHDELFLINTHSSYLRETGVERVIKNPGKSLQNPLMQMILTFSCSYLFHRDIKRVFLYSFSHPLYWLLLPKLRKTGEIVRAVHFSCVRVCFFPFGET